PGGLHLGAADGGLGILGSPCPRGDAPRLTLEPEAARAGSLALRPKKLAVGRLKCQVHMVPKSPPSTARERPLQDELDQRRAAILEAVVTEYVGSATPVGSAYVAGAPGVNVSSATVRSDMAALEREGYLVQPHTSAGRIPTDKGYRFFVDHLAQPGLLTSAERQRVKRFFDRVHGEMEDMLERASMLLSQLTPYAAVVISPSHDSATVRSAQLVSLAPHLVLLVVVFSDGSVEKRTVEFAEELSDDELTLASAALQRTIIDNDIVTAAGLVGALGAVNARLPDAIARALREIAVAEESDHVFMGGSSRVAGAFDAVDTVRSVLGILEQQLVVVTLLRDVLDRGLSVAIGTEHGFEPLASCAVVVAPVSIGSNETGAVGLLGPTRMNYPQALAAAHLVSSELSERMNEALGRPRETDRKDARGDA
ncbi:MAG: heat-inducible transcriptional repressor HrcA, partial [Acidimicrobiales bacterium]